MSTKAVSEALMAPFEPSSLEWRIQSSGVSGGKPWAKILCYVDARAVMNRFDSVLGIENWRVNYTLHKEGVIAHLSLKLGDEWVTKEDGSHFTDTEPFKGGLSKALVRAANVWGVGRYLYSLPVTFARFVEKGTKDAHFDRIDGTSYYWLPPGSDMGEEKVTRELPSHEDQRGIKPFVPHSGDLGSYVISFGKFSGKKLSDISYDEITSYVEFLKQSSVRSKKPLTNPVKELIEKVALLEHAPVREIPAPSDGDFRQSIDVPF